MAQTVPIQISVTDVPEVIAVLRAARDVVDHVEHPEDLQTDDRRTTRVSAPFHDIARLRDALEPLMPGPVVKEA